MSATFSEVGPFSRTPSITCTNMTRPSRLSMCSKLSFIPPKESEIEPLRLCLRRAVRGCHSRGITKAAQWAAGLLVSLPPSNETTADRESFPDSASTEERGSYDHQEDLCMLARMYFDTCEYERAAQLLEKAESDKAIFLRHYALYMATEKYVRGQILRNEDPLKLPPDTKNHLFSISESLNNLTDLDGYCLYLHGLLQLKMDFPGKALELLLKSIELEPYNWSAWEGICSLMKTSEQLEEIIPILKPNIMRSFFILNLASSYEIYHIDTQKELERLKALFPGCSYLDLQEATLYYKQTQYEKSLEIFEKYRNKEPYSLECADYESNMLFVLEDIQRLGTLSRHTFSIDRYRYESCIAVGNYFCLRRDHLKAIKYFERALKLKPGYTDVYIMIGHEYLEEKNINAAMEAYRCAAETSPRDFRGWYGMGHTLASIEQLSEALVYFQNAASRQPEDARPWTQLGYLYQRLSIPELAAQCWKRALNCVNTESIVLYNLGSLYAFEKCEFQNDKVAVAYFSKFLAKTSVLDKTSHSVVSSKTYLAAYYLENRDFKNCIKHLRDVIDTNHGTALLSELSTILSNENEEIDKEMRKTYLTMLHKPYMASESNDTNIDCNSQNTDFSYISPANNRTRTNSVMSLKSFPLLDISALSDTNRLSISSIKSQSTIPNRDENAD